MPPLQDLECNHIKQPELLNSKVEDNTKGCKLLQIQEDHKVNWQEYTFQEVIESVAVEDIITYVNEQCVEQLEEDYIAYKNQDIQTMVDQLQTWYVITTKENLAIKAHFLKPWGDTPDAHITTFALQLDRLQVKC